MQNREKLIDYGHRAVHEMTVKAQGASSPPSTATRRGSPTSTAARPADARALKAAQMLPRDFDGIVAGAPALNATGRAAFAMWVAQNLHKDEASYIPPTKYPAIHDAVLAGVRRGRRREDRRDREPDARARSIRRCWRARRAMRTRCLTPPQVEAARKMYQPAGEPADEEGDLPGPRLRQRAGLGHVRRPAAVRHRHADVPVHGLQQPELGLQDAELRQRHGARGQGRERAHQRAGSRT